MFRREWVIEINEMLNDRTPKAGGIMRIYWRRNQRLIPHSFSRLGLTTIRSWRKILTLLVRNVKISTVQGYKGKSAVTLSRKLQNFGKNFNSIVDMTEELRPEIECFYHWPASKESDYS